MLCKLCKLDRTLQKSHIIPEFFYNPLYDKIHRFHGLSTHKDDKNLLIQKGIREELLCFDCEQKFSNWECYTRELFFSKKLKLTYSIQDKTITFHGVDYKNFKLFQLSLIWRSNIAKHDLFRNVNLGPHEENIRLMLYNQDPGPFYKYGAFLILLKDNQQPLVSLIMQPDELRMDNYRVYRFVLGSAFWFYVVSNHNEKFPAYLYFLQENGDLRVMIKDFSEIDLFQEFARRLLVTGKLLD
jgi:hypothetical protein